LTYLVTSDDQTLCRALKLIGGMLLGLMVFIGFLALVVSLVPSMRQLLVEFILPLLVAGGGTLGLAKMAKKKDPAASPKAPPEAVPAPPEPGPPAPEALQGSNAEEVDPPPPREQE
jgi:H+/Cl- antiporter ClcA